jgi:molybdenum-dependent DNA-binding transcriptional regulator ModE
MNQTAIYVNGSWFWLSCEAWKKLVAPQKQNEQIVELGKKGLSISEIAKMMGKKYHDVWYILRRKNETLRSA